MVRGLFGIPFIILAAVFALVGARDPAQSGVPRLVVVIAVDQMRADYLDRFLPQYTGGLARLAQRGAIYTDAHQEHAITHTAPGHASISTGVFPARSGIVSNDWWDRAEKRPVYAAEDSNASIIGRPELPGRSPIQLLRESLGDWLKAASRESKVFSVAIKDRSAILMGGTRPDGAYWYDLARGRFVTSSYYREDYPDWVVEFNESGAVESYFGAGWTRLLPSDAYDRSRADSFPAENDGVHSTFPHLFTGGQADTTAAAGSATDSIGSAYYQALPGTPFGDELTLAFSKALVTNESVGADVVPDILFIGASAADFIGHSYGPHSQEVQDYYLRLDHYLDDFFAFLDGRVGAQHYAVVLTSDHGVMALPEELASRGIDSRRLGTLDLQQALVPALTETMQEMGIAAQPSLRLLVGLIIDFPGAELPEREWEEFRRKVAERMRRAEILEDVLSYDELAAGDIDGPYAELYLRSFHSDRFPDIFFRAKENYLLSSLQFGTSHGSPYRYDTHVPVVFLGSGIAPGEHHGRVRTVDIAPTLAQILGVEAPDDLDGRVLTEIAGAAEEF